MKAILVCGGDPPGRAVIHRYYEPKKDLLIGVDRGTSHILRDGLVPDLVFGDLDSIDPFDLAAIREKRIRIHKYPSEKDFTDSAAAVAYAIGAGYREIVLLGAIGKRVDHMTANILSMRTLAEAGVSCVIADGNNEMTAITDQYRRSLSDFPFQTTTVSLVPLTDEVTGITTRGLKYQLANATLKMLTPSHGISNEVVEDYFEVDIYGSGVLLVCISKD